MHEHLSAKGPMLRKPHLNLLCMPLNPDTPTSPAEKWSKLRPNPKTFHPASGVALVRYPKKDPFMFLAKQNIIISHLLACMLPPHVFHSLVVDVASGNPARDDECALQETATSARRLASNTLKTNVSDSANSIQKGDGTT